MEKRSDLNPTERTLEVLEYIMAAGPGPVKQIDIARHCGLSPSTLNRIVKSLSDWGYLFRTSEKYCVRNFRLERNVPLSESYLAKLVSTICELSDEFGVSAEVVVVAGHELLWHSKTEHPDSDVVIRANVGFRRSLYELDVLSKLYLSRLNWEEVEAQFFTEGFYAVLPAQKQGTQRLPETDVKQQIDSLRGEIFATDPEPNHMGIHRFATVVEDPDKKFLHLLTLATSANRIKNEANDIKPYREALLKAREDLAELVYAECATKRLRPKHHALPHRGG